VIDSPAVEPAAAVPQNPEFPAAPPRPHVLPLQFTGRAGEYFRIWIVNLFLSIVTLGLYSAWAKVRRRRYFYGHAWLDGSNFEYHGDPRVILRGRLIAVALFLAYTLAGRYSPRLAAGLALLALPLVPWLLVRSFRFNAVSTSYRNVRFAFDGRYGDFFAAILPVVVFPLATVAFGRYDPNGARAPTAPELFAAFAPAIVFGLAYPWMSGRLHRLRVNGSRFGTARFDCSATVGEFYGLYIIAGLVMVALGIAFFGPLVAIGAAAGALKSFWILAAVAPLAYVGLLSCSLGYTQSRVANLVYGNTTLEGGVSMRSTLRARTLAGVYFTNAFAIVFSVGLAIPWAAIRVARVRAAALEIVATQDLEHFVAGAAAPVGATGEEVGELFAFDVAL